MHQPTKIAKAGISPSLYSQFLKDRCTLLESAARPSLLLANRLRSWRFPMSVPQTSKEQPDGSFLLQLL